MSILHTVNKSPYETNSLKSCLRYVKKGSAMLLIEDGIYAALEGSVVEKDLAKASNEISLYCLEPDLKARGYSTQNLIKDVKLVNYEGFVNLTVEHDKVQAWF